MGKKSAHINKGSIHIIYYETDKIGNDIERHSNEGNIEKDNNDENVHNTDIKNCHVNKTILNLTNQTNR